MEQIQEKKKMQHKKDVFMDQEKGEIICLCCGQVLESRLVDPIQSDSLGDACNNIHTERTTLSTHDNSLGSIASSNKVGPNHYKNDPGLLKTIINYRLKGKHYSPTERRLYLYFRELQYFKNQIHLTLSEYQGISYLIRKAEKENLLQSKKTKTSIAALIVLSLKQNGRLIQPSVYYSWSNSMFLFNRYYAEFKEKLEINTNVEDQRVLELYRLSNLYHVNKKITDQCLAILEYCRKNNICPTKKPASFCGTIFYIVMKSNDPKFSFFDFVDISGLSHGIITNIKAELKDVIHIFNLSNVLKKSIKNYRGNY